MRKRLLIALPLVLFLTVGISAAANAAVAPANPGFEQDGAATGSPSGWQSTGKRAADFTEAGGHSGRFHLSHWSAQPFKAETTQRVSGLQHGWYTLRAWVRGSAGDNDSSIALEGCSRDEARVAVPVSSSWLQIVVSAHVDRRILRDRAPHQRLRRRVDELRRRRARSRRGAAVGARRRRLEPRRSPRTRAASTAPSTAGRATRSTSSSQRRASTSCGCASGSTRPTATTTRPSCSRWPAGRRRPGSAGPRRSPLLGLLGRSGQAVDAGGLGGQDVRPAPPDLHRLHPRHRGEPHRAGNAAGDGPDRQRDQPRAALGLLGDLDRLLVGGRRRGRDAHGLPHRELGRRRPAADGRLRRGQVGVALDEGDAPPGGGRQQRHLPLVVRQRHHPQRPLRRDRRLVLRLLARLAGPAPVQPERRRDPLRQGRRSSPRRRTRSRSATRTAGRTSSTSRTSS